MRRSTVAALRPPEACQTGWAWLTVSVRHLDGRAPSSRASPRHPIRACSHHLIAWKSPRLIALMCSSTTMVSIFVYRCPVLRDNTSATSAG